MGSCILFCAAGFDGLQEPIGQEDYIIAADGGLTHTRALGLTPHETLGDFDSLGYIPDRAEVYPVEKDDTDSMLAAKRGLTLGFRRFLIYGGMDGRRLDHTVANFQLLSYLAAHGARGYLIGRDFIACAIRNGDLRFPAECRGGFSVFCSGADAHGVTVRGMKYGAEGVTLTASFPLGVSNSFTGRPASVTVEDGTLLALWDRRAGMPEEP